MPVDIIQQVGTAIVLADSTDHSPATANNLGTRTDQIDLTSLGIGAARQSAKVDLGANRAVQYAVIAALEMDVAPTAGRLVKVYWAPSPSATAATANPGGVSGSDSAYSGYSSNLADSLKHLQFIGALPMTVQIATTVQIGYVGVFSPPERYGTLVVFNDTDQAFEGDAVEMSVLLSPIQDVFNN